MRGTMMAAVLAAAALAGSGEAAVQIVSFSGSGSTMAMMPLFNASLGTLQSARVSASYDSSAGFVSWGFTPDDHAVAGLFTLGGLSFALNGVTNTTLDAPPFGTFSISGTGAGTFSSAADLALLTGGSLVLAAQVNAAVPGQLMGGSPMAAIGYTISYSYEDGQPAARRARTAEVAAVPEPASWAMMIGGFGLVCLALRRARGRQGPAMVDGPPGMATAFRPALLEDSGWRRLSPSTP